MGLATIAREWGRLGCVGFGGPPTHIALLRALCVDRHRWLGATDFEDGIAAVNLLPGPASTQLAIYTAWRIRGRRGALVGGLCFITPGLILILGLATVFLADHPPLAVAGAALGASAAVPAVATHAALGLAPAGWRRAGPRAAARVRWIGYLLAGGAATAAIGPWLAVVLAACGIMEVGARHDRATRRDRPAGDDRRNRFLPVPLLATITSVGGVGSLAWVALKVGALSYGGGFVIIPLMQHDAVETYHWMTATQFLSAVALGQITPGPVVQTVAVVGYAAHGVGGGLLAAAFAFGPSFLFVLLGGPHFDRIRSSARAQAFLTGAGAAAIGAIAGSAVPLTLALTRAWQLAVLAAALVWLHAARRSVVTCLVGAAGIGLAAALLGAPT